MATVGAWKKVEDKRLDDRPSAFLRCLLYGGMIAALTISRVSESGASVYSAVAPGLVALVFLGLAGFHVAGFAKRGAGTVGSWGRGLLLVLLAECAGLAFVLAIGALWIDPTLLRGEVVPHFAGWLALLALAAVPVTGIVAAALALRDIGSAEIRSLAMDRGGRPTETALAEERSEAKSATGKAEPIGPGRTPRRGAWAAHAGWWKDGLDRTSLLLSTIWGAVLLMALNVGVILEPIRAAWVLIPVTFLIPRRVTVDHRSRAYLLGMDLRDQARHDLRALLLFAVAPAFLFCAGTLALVGWRDDQAPALTLLASVFLVRAGWPGLRLAGMRMATAVAVLGSASGLAARPDPIWVCAAAALLAALGIMGLIHLLTRTEDDLRADMRILGT